MEKMTWYEKENLGQWAGGFVIFVFVILLAFNKKQKPEYTDPNSALSYIWDNMRDATEKIDADSVSYVYVSCLLDSQRVIQIMKFKNFIQDGDEILVKETKFGWNFDSITREKENLIKFVYENYY